MSKAGDSTTTTSTSSLPPELQPYYTDLLGQAQTASQQPYVPYQDQRLTNFSTPTTDAMAMVSTVAGQGTADVDNALATTTGLTGYTAGTIPEADLAAYMNPYTTNVLDVQKSALEQSYLEQQASRDAEAVAAGAFGGDRRFVSDSLAQRDMNQQMQAIDAAGLQAAYDSATGLWQQDEANRMAAGQLGLDAAAQAGALSQVKQDLGLNAASALSGVGAKLDQRNQAGLDLAYQDFQDQQNWKNNQLSLYSQLLSGTPVNPSTSTTTTTPTDWLSQLLGAGTSIAGLADLLG